MADDRTFLLIGAFRDEISPGLAKINSQLASLRSSFSNLGGKGARGASRDMGRFSAAVSSLTDNLRAQNQELRAASAPLREYRKEIGKTVGAYKQLNAAGGNVSGLQATNRAMEEQLRLMGQIRRAQGTRLTPGALGGGGSTPRRSSAATPTAGGGGGLRSRGGGGGGYGGGGERFPLAEAGFGYSLGNAISQPIQNAIVAGFQIGVSFMTKPFQYFTSAFGERVRDELSDLKAAGGLYSISKRSTTPFLRDIDDAIQFQQETNETFAKMAAALPGVTNDYVQVGKRLSDTAARIVSTDFAKAKQEAVKIRETEEGRKFYGGAIKGSQAEQQKEIITTILGELTKKTTIAGLGGKSGAGGVAGAYGLPGLTERMLSQQQVTVGQFQRYAAVFSDPTIADALQRNVKNINASQANSIERFKAIQKLLDEVVTPELIEKLRTSVDGVYQGLKSAFLDPDTGLFGLGRNFEKFGKKLNQYGQYVNTAGKVVDNMALAADENLSIYEILRDIFSNAGQALMPLADSLRLIFDPLKKVSSVLLDARHYAAQFSMSFNRYREGLKILSEQTGKGFLKDTLDVRASLMAITNLLYQFGAIGSGDFKSISKSLGSKDLDIGKTMSDLLDKVLNSDIAKNIGKTVGEVIGTVLSEVAKVTGFISGRISKSNKLFEGIKKGFEDSGGSEALKNIFKDVFKSMFKILVEVMKLIPMEGYLLMGAMAIVPAAVQGLGIILAQKIVGGIKGIGKVAGDSIKKNMVKGGTQAAKSAASASTPFLHGTSAGKSGAASSAAFRAMPGRTATGFGHIALPGKPDPGIGGVSGPFAAPSIGKRMPPLKKPSFGALSSIKAKGVGTMAAGMIALSTHAPALAKTGKALTSIGAKLPLLNIAFAGLDFGLRKAEGTDTATAAAGAGGSLAGGLVGGALGSLIPVPVVGTAIGTILGSIIGDWIGSQLPAFFATLPSKLSAAWEGLKRWFNDLPRNLGYVIGYTVASVEIVWSRFQTWWNGLGPHFSTMLTRFTSTLRGQIDMLGNRLKDPAQWGKMMNDIKVGFSNALGSVGTYIKTKIWEFFAGMRQGAAEAGIPKNPPDKKPKAKAYGEPGASFGNFGAAANYEMKHKPAGTGLIVGNTSETVIPAAGGYGMEAMISTFQSGLNAIVTAIQRASQESQNHLNSQVTSLSNTFKYASERQRAEIATITQTLRSNQTQTNARLSALEKKFASPGLNGGLGGGSVGGGVDAFTPMAQKYGLQMTSGYRPGDPGWHGANRARDFSNGTGPTPQMMQFAQYMASSYGSNLKELIYTPLGFSIKNGQQVAPYAQGAHYNHVHVAYATGMPTMFSNRKDALNWENKATLGNVKVSSITARQGELGGSSPITINAPVTIHQQPGQNADQLAALVAIKIGEAVADARSASIFV